MEESKEEKAEDKQAGVQTYLMNECRRLGGTGSLYSEGEGKNYYNHAGHRAALEAAISVLYEPFTVDFAGQYDRFLSYHGEVAAIRNYYADMLRRVDARDKREKSILDLRLSTAKNPTTGKVYTRDAIKALIESGSWIEDPEKEEDVLLLCSENRLRYQSILSFLTELASLYEYKQNSLREVNINTRRTWEVQS